MPIPLINLRAHQVADKCSGVQCAGLSAILILYLWGSCIAYLVIIGDSFSPLIALAVGAPPVPSLSSLPHVFLTAAP